MNDRKTADQRFREREQWVRGQAHTLEEFPEDEPKPFGRLGPGDVQARKEFWDRVERNRAESVREDVIYTLVRVRDELLERPAGERHINDALDLAERMAPYDAIGRQARKLLYQRCPNNGRAVPPIAAINAELKAQGYEEEER